MVSPITPFVDMYYVLTIGKLPPKKMSEREKITRTVDKVVKTIFNLKVTDPKSSRKKTTDTQTTTSTDVDSIVGRLKQVSGLYEDIVVSYFSDRKLILDLSDMCRNMSKILHESGSLESIEILYPSLEDAYKNTLDIYSLNGTGRDAVVMIRDNGVVVVNAGANFKLSDVIVGHTNGDVYVFQATGLKNVASSADNMIPVNLGMPLHTQIYRFFFPEDFDVSQIQTTQQLIQERGLEYVIKLYVTNTLKLDSLF